MGVSEALGRAIGGILAPVTGVGSLARRARLFHPSGVVARAEVRTLVHGGPLGDLGEALSGAAIVRLSSAWWKGDAELPDILGVAVRLCEAEGGVSPRDQDLLFASFRHVALLPLGPLTTNVHDFLANRYYAVLPFHAPGLGLVKLRLSPRQPGSEGKTRKERLASAIASGRASFRLEVRRERLGSPWLPLAVIELLEIVSIDQQSLAFTPFRAGRGIEPVGFFHMMRAATYASSVLGRRLVDRPID